MKLLQAGVENLVRQCADIQPGERVLVLNEQGNVEPEVAEAIAATVLVAGGSCQVVWHEGLGRDYQELPDWLVDEFMRSDKVICNFDLKRSVVDRHTRGTSLVRINNTCRTVQAMSTPHALYSWHMVRAIFAQLEEIFATASIWRITSPAGTELTGRVGKGSEIADAYFAAEAAATRLIRVFPGEVYTPIGSVEAEGQIVVEYINMRDELPWTEPAVLHVRDNQVTGVDGGANIKAFAKQIDRAGDLEGERARVVDSWHGGMNPAARIPTVDNPSLRGATSGPALMHFHLGRTLEPISGGILNHTLEVDGKRIYDPGKLLILENQPWFSEGAPSRRPAAVTS